MNWVWENSGKLGDFAQIATAILASIALVFAGMQISASTLAQQQATAYSAYREYMRLAFDHPQFADPSSLALNVDKDQIAGSSENFEKYVWFVSFMLHATEEIWLTSPTEDWRRTINDQLCDHSEYLRSKKFVESGQSNHFSPEFWQLAKESLASCQRN